MSGKASIGTSGWMYKHWRGDLYEPGFAQHRWLSRIAQLFDSVEVNTSFYGIPRPQTIDSWLATTPNHFCFAIKLWRGITHYRKLYKASDLTNRFLDVVQSIPLHRRAPLLIQLPPHHHPDLPRLKSYINEFHDLSAYSWQVAVEFRDDAWLTSEVYALLDSVNASICLHDMKGRGAAALPNNAEFVYVRRHGSSEQKYAGNYSPQAIARDAENVRLWTSHGKDVYVYYNNDIGGHAFRNALALKSMLS